MKTTLYTVENDYLNGKKGLYGSYDTPVNYRAFISFMMSIVVGFFIYASTVEPVEAGTQWVDVSNQVTTTIGNPLRSRRSPDARVRVTVQNSSSDVLELPLRLFITDLTSTVSVGNASGTTTLGPYIDLAGTVAAPGLQPGASVYVDLVISGGGRVLFSFATALYQEQTIADPGPLSVLITAPATLVTVGHSPLAVSGTTNQSGANVTLNGVAVTVNGDGSFRGDVELSEGFNTVVARATNGAGEDVSSSISVSLDMTPPNVTIESHSDGQTVFSNTVTITGLVNDIVRGTIEASQAAVTVNGKVATISNRSYSASGVPLVVGSNTITVNAADQVGNSDSISIFLVYQEPVGRRVLLESGQGQSSEIGSVLGAPLVVKVLDGSDQPVVGETVIFRVQQGSGAVGAGTANEGRAVVASSNSEGKAGTLFKLGSRTGSNNHRVRAQVVGFDGEVIFTASATPKLGDKISINSGNNQRGSVEQPLPAPFVVAVTDEGANAVQGARVRFDVTQGGGEFQNSASTFETTTDSDGRATALLTLGSQEGLDVHRAAATLLDTVSGAPVSAGFTASGFKPADPGLTKVSGVVLDNQDRPIPGVTIRIENTNRSTTTDQEGQFTVTESPVGPIHLIADGSTATVAGEYPSLSYNLVTIAGVDNPLASPIYMVKLNTANAVRAGSEDVSLTLDKFPGFQLDIFGNSATFPDGSREGLISVTAVNADKVPMAPPNGMQPQFIVTIQPTGTLFDPPARLTLPNVDGHAPGAQVEMYSFDHDLEEFVSIGLGTVAEDGSVVTSNPGVGVVKAGWHCGSQPSGSGCTHNCPECASCNAQCICYWDNSLTPTSIPNTPGDCKKSVCQNGPKQIIDDTDEPANGCCLNGVPHPDPTPTSATGIAAVNYIEKVIAPTSGNWGEMTPITGKELDVDIAAYYHAGSDTWRAKVNKADSTYSIWWRNLAEFTASAAVATPANCAGMIADLQALGVPGTGHYYTAAAVEAHERVHVTEWQTSLNPKFTTMKGTIEALTVPNKCGKTAAQAKAELKAKAAYSAAITKAKNDAGTVFWAIPDPNANTNAAEQAVVNPIITAIRAKANAGGATWPAACK